MIAYGKQHIDAADIRAVVSALRGPKITQGPWVERFEEALARYCGAKHAVAVTSGTAALHLACLAAGIGPGDEVITSPVTFLASANAVLYAGAKPVFADIDPATGNISAETVRKALTPRTRAVIVVHLAGQPADMAPLASLARKKGLLVIEDACHALGAGYRGTKTGSCAHSDMAIFSFHPVKLVTTGEGGAITLRDKKYLAKLKALRSHGMYRDEALSRKKGGWYYEMRELGFNYRLTDIQSALGVSQLKKVNGFLTKRRRIAEKYNKAFSDLKGYAQLPAKVPGTRHAWHLYLFRLLAGSSQRGRFFEYLRRNGIQPQVHYIPVYRQPYYQKNLKINASRFPHSEKYYAEAVSLPIYPDLTKAQSDKVIRVVRRFFGKGGK